MQRFFDILFSLTALLALSPILIFIMLILRFSGEGEIFYTQARVGRYRKSFRLIKFATMLKDSPLMGSGTVTVKNDPRVLPFGRLLRKTKVNELPQLLNVLLGDMSLIGPRPLTTQTFNMYSLTDQEIISMVRPGLSGLGSIYFRNEEDFLLDHEKPLDVYANTIAPQKAKIEIYFINNVSLSLYFELIFVTVIAVIFSKKFDACKYVETKMHNTS